jgi:hypothetical protein
VTYSSVAAVKSVLQIKAYDESFDDEIESCIASADAMIDGLLKKSGLTVPEEVPQLVADACTYFAAWLLEQRNLCGNLRAFRYNFGHFCGAEGMKGKPWTREQEKQLRELVKSGESLSNIAAKMEKSKQAIRRKIDRLKLEVVGHKPADSRTTTSKLVLPAELISAEDALKMLVGALKMACTPGLSKVEVQRLQVVATLARTYSEKLQEYLDLRGLEKRLFELEGKYAELAKKAQGNCSSK